MQDGDHKLHKIIEAGTDCGRGKDPEVSGMVLQYDSDYCDINNDNQEDVKEYVNIPVNSEKIICENDVISNELNNADLSNDNDDQDSISKESIDSRSETEAVNQIVTQISGSTQIYCHWLSLMTILVTIVIIQH